MDDFRVDHGDMEVRVEACAGLGDQECELWDGGLTVVSRPLMTAHERLE